MADRPGTQSAAVGYTACQSPFMSGARLSRASKRQGVFPMVPVRIALWLLLVLLTVVGVAMVVFQLPELPERVATHFDGAGRPNGFMSRQGHLATMVALLVGTPILFAGISALIRILPASLINIPYRNYWLAPERREETIRVVDLFLLIMAIGTEVFMMGIAHLVYRANVGNGQLSNTAFLTLLCGYLALTLGGCIYLLVRFGRPPADHASMS
ncbi:MAG: DUF1648 domain-containing protein [Planctomycetota bacterium]|nr:MAG: DUF1648 domain-containing protein [Planctomycetota bacterium]